MKFLRAIRLDPSDTFVFERAAEPGEWAVSGSFLFLAGNPQDLTNKERHALRSGFLGIDTLGFSTLATVAEISSEELETVREKLARGFFERLGAPSLIEARRAACEEVRYGQTLCDHPVGTLVAVQRTIDEEGALHEKFRTLRPRERDQHQDSLHALARAFAFHEVEDESEPQESVDLLALGKAKPN